MNTLDVQQQAAVDHQEGPVRVKAGPGAGKSACLTQRIVRLIKSGVPQSQILAVTFSKAAANEMLERVAKLLNVKPSAVKARISTIHSLGYNIFMRHKSLVGYKGPHAVSDGRCYGLLRKLLKTPHTPYEGIPFAVARAHISAAKKMDLSPADLAKRPNSDARLVRLYADFEKEKRELGLVSFDDMIFCSWRILRDHADIRERYQKDFKWVLCDEHHDVNEVQQKMISALTAPENNIWIVFDFYQSIFGFQGADPTICRDFDKRYPSCKTILLGKNYRSRPAIVALYKKLIAQDPEADMEFINSIQAVREQGDRPEPVFQRFMYDFLESDYVAARIGEIRAKEKDASIAVLYRTNKQSRAVEESLRAAKITYVVRGSSSFFRLKEVKGAIAFLKFVENTADNAALEEIIMSPNRVAYGLGKTFLDALKVKAGKGPMLDILAHGGFDGTRFESKARNAWGTLMRILTRCNSAGQFGRDVGYQLEAIYESAGLVREDSDEAHIDNSPAENLKELLRAARRFQTRKEFLSYACSFSGESSVSNAIELMSIHRSKGLEYDHIFLVGCDQDTLPHKFCADIEEERRLCYVGVSRARETLHILSHDRPSEFFDSWPVEANLLEQVNK
jgi:DNA helicase-2/ATP-dependent DNA helicase PcrA